MIAVGVNYVRLVLKQLFAYPGMGITRLMFGFELSNKDQNSAGYPMWLSGRAEVQAPGGSRLHVGRLQPGTPQPISIGPFGREVNSQVTLDLTSHQFWLIDESRINGAVRMFLAFDGHVVIDGQYVAIQPMQPFEHQISQSDWLEVVQQAGLKRVILAEFEAPDSLTHPELAQALDYYSMAQTRYSEHEWRPAVESVRQCLAALVGQKAEDEDQEPDIQDAVKAAYKQAHAGQVGYGPRMELVRRAAKFMSDLGAHPEAAETRKHDAYAALMIAGGLLHAFTTQQA